MSRSQTRKVLTPLCAAAIAVTLLSAPDPAAAALGDCSQPVSTGVGPAASDCLYVLRTAVGSQVCTPECLCDATGSGGVTAADALVCLRRAVGQQVALACPCGSITVSASTSGTALAGQAISAVADIQAANGCVANTITWTQPSGFVTVTIDNADTDTATVNLPAESAFKNALLGVLAEPPIGPDELPPYVHAPEGEFVGGLQSRYDVVGLNPFALEEAGLLTLQVEVTASCGTASDTVDVHTTLPWKPTSGLRNVPVGTRVLMHGKDHIDEDEDGFNDDTGADVTMYDWALTAKPAGSMADLIDPTAQNPELVPDVAGVYTIEVTDTTQLPGTDVVSFHVHAGTWRGVIAGQDVDGRPIASSSCTGCHNDAIAPDKFTPWAQTGHAEIFTDNLNTSTHYGGSCFSCHMVGYDLDAANGGTDDAADYQDFLTSGLLNVPGDNWSAVLATYPALAQLANIQCENCHGPQSGGSAHLDVAGSPRVSLSSDVCATCHGEPLRHARYQQWQISAHANYELAVDEGTSGSCSRCHTANGFVKWVEVLLDDDPLTDPLANVTVDWTEDEIHPQTCVTCHDPHAPGSTTGIGTNATVRITDNTPLLIAGFKAFGVGRGAICMTCHNTRRGLRNDGNFVAGTSDAATAPHGSAQTDMLMGQNAYLVSVGIRGKHSLLEDTCVNCHMEQTPPPADLSSNLGGTNHTFYASDTICSNCHGAAFTAKGVQAAFQGSLEELKSLIEASILQLMADQIAAGNVIVVAAGSADETTVTDIAEIDSLDFGEGRGQHAVTVHFADMTTIENVRLTSIAVRDGNDPLLCPAPLTRCQLYDFADDALPKSGWNYNLVNNDGSRGVHNPAFTLEVLGASIDALTTVLMTP